MAFVVVDLAASTVHADGFFDVGVVASTLAKIGYHAVPATEYPAVASRTVAAAPATPESGVGKPL